MEYFLAYPLLWLLSNNGTSFGWKQSTLNWSYISVPLRCAGNANIIKLKFFIAIFLHFSRRPPSQTYGIFMSGWVAALVQGLLRLNKI